MLVKITEENYFYLFPPDKKDVCIDCSKPTLKEGFTVVELEGARVAGCLCPDCAKKRKDVVTPGELGTRRRRY